MERTRQADRAGTGRHQHRPRKHKRMRAPLLLGDLSDGTNVFQGIVEDFSTGGIRLADITDSYCFNNEICTVMVSTGQHNFRLVVKPCWYTKEIDGNNQKIGFKVIDAPWKWIRLTLEGNSRDLENFGYSA